eukprot:1394025-Rhodomonas_salina.2
MTLFRNQPVPAVTQYRGHVTYDHVTSPGLTLSAGGFGRGRGAAQRREDRVRSPLSAYARARQSPVKAGRRAGIAYGALARASPLWYCASEWQYGLRYTVCEGSTRCAVLSKRMPVPGEAFYGQEKARPRRTEGSYHPTPPLRHVRY